MEAMFHTCRNAVKVSSSSDKGVLLCLHIWIFHVACEFWEYLHSIKALTGEQRDICSLFSLLGKNPIILFRFTLPTQHAYAQCQGFGWHLKPQSGVSHWYFTSRRIYPLLSSVLHPLSPLLLPLQPCWVSLGLLVWPCCWWSLPRLRYKTLECRVQIHLDLRYYICEYGKETIREK